MRTIDLTIEGDALIPSDYLAGQTGEHQDTALTVTLPEEWADCTCTFRFYITSQNKHYQTMPLTTPVSFALPQALMVAGELLVYLDAREGYTVHRTGPATLRVEESPDWCGVVGLAPDPYEGLIEASLQEFADTLDDLRGQAEDMAQLRDDMTAIADQVSADKAEVSAAAEQVRTEAQEIDKQVQEAARLAGEVTDAHADVQAWAGQASADKTAAEAAAKAAKADAASVLESRNAVDAAATQVQNNADLVGQNTETVTDAAAQVAQDKAAAEEAAEKAKADADRADKTVAGFEGYTKQESNNRYGYALTGTAEGITVTLTDEQADTTLLSLQACGKTTLSGAPASNAPVTMTGACTGGSVTITAGGQEITMDCPALYNLPDGTADTVDAVTGETVIRVQAKVLDGTEAWYKSAGYSTPGVPAFGLLNVSTSETPKSLYCTHFPGALQPYSTTERVYMDQNMLIAVRAALLADETVESFKAWLAAQKSSGTPVTVLCPRDTPILSAGNAHTVLAKGTIAASGQASVRVTYRKDTQQVIDTLTDNIIIVANPESWSGVQSLIRAGWAQKVFAIGDQLECNHKTYGKLVWDVIGFDMDAMSVKDHSMTLQLHSLINETLTFDAAEAIYYAETGLDPGTYYITITGQDWYPADNGVSYQFTLTKPLPAGGQLMLSATFNSPLEGKSIVGYADNITNTAIETAILTQGTGGVNLGMTDGTGAVNHIQCALFGSNDYTQSDMRLFLNGSASTEWTPANKFSRRPAWVTVSSRRFVEGLDEDFLEVVGETPKLFARNTVTGDGGLVTISDRFFLLSNSEVYGAGENEGDPYPYYADYSSLSAPGNGIDANRAKYNASAKADYWVLRSARRDNASSCNRVYPAGNITSGVASTTSGIVPACCIY